MTATPTTTAPWPEIDWLNPAARVEVTPTGGWYSAAKPAFDYVAAVIILIPALPVIAITWAIVRLTSAGPGFYVQQRAGRYGRPYPIFKLRTMRHNIEAKTGIQWSQKGDDRITPIGKFLRKTHLDELPQLFNVLRGEMSLVGPRPERPEVIRGKGLANQVPGYSHRLDVKPGVTGLAQLQLPADSDIASVRHKVVYDLYYINNQSLWIDFRLVVATAFKAAGFGPSAIRKLFFFPTRNEVAADFHRSLNALPPPESLSSTSLQPV